MYLAEIAHRALRCAVDVDLEVQMRTGGVAGRTDCADGLAGGNRLTDRYVNRGLMAVSRHDAAAVIDNGVVAVAGDPACGRNRAGGRRNDGCAGRRRDVLALVELAGAVNRMDTPAISAGGNSVARQRPGERAAVTVAVPEPVVVTGLLPEEFFFCSLCRSGSLGGRLSLLARLLGDLGR